MCVNYTPHTFMPNPLRPCPNTLPPLPIFHFTHFFFPWHYNLLWVLVFSLTFFHSALSLHCFLHPFTPIICLSPSISRIHLFLGLLPLYTHPDVSSRYAGSVTCSLALLCDMFLIASRYLCLNDFQVKGT